MPEPWSSLVIFVITVFCEVESERFWMSRESVEYRLVRRLLDQMLNRAASIRAAQGTDPGARQGVLRGSVAAPPSTRLPNAVEAAERPDVSRPPRRFADG